MMNVGYLMFQCSNRKTYQLFLPGDGLWSSMLLLLLDGETGNGGGVEDLKRTRSDIFHSGIALASRTPPEIDVDKLLAIFHNQSPGYLYQTHC